MEASIDRDPLSPAGYHKNLRRAGDGRRLQAAESGVIAAVFHLEELLDITAGKDLLRRAETVHMPVTQAEDGVGKLLGEVELMHGEDGGDLLLAHQFFQQMEELEFMADIQERSGFVHNQKLRILRNSPGQKDALALPVTEAVEVSVPKREHTHKAHRLFDCENIILA